MGSLTRRPAIWPVNEQPFLVSWEGGEGHPHPCLQPSSSIKGPVLLSKCSPSKRSGLDRCPMSTEARNTWEPVPHTFSDGNLADFFFFNFEFTVTSASGKKKKEGELGDYIEPWAAVSFSLSGTQTFYISNDYIKFPSRIGQFSHSVMSDSLWPLEPQHARPPCPTL